MAAAPPRVPLRPPPRRRRRRPAGRRLAGNFVASTLASANTQLVTPGATAFDEQGYLYVLNTSTNLQGGTACSILAFAPNATGNVAPAATIPSVCGSGIATVRTVVLHGPVSRRRGS